VRSLLRGTKEIIIGPTGTGKTTCIGTMVDAGIETFVLFIGEGGLTTLLGRWADHGEPIPENLHWHVLEAPAISFEDLARQAHDVNTKTYKQLVDAQDSKRSLHNQIEQLYLLLNDFIDQKDGKHYGPVDSWGTGRCLAVDSLTGLSSFAMALVVGAKTTLDKPHYGQAQKQIEIFLHKMIDGCRCHFLITAHPDRQVDEILGGMKIYPGTVGKALGPTIGPLFDDVLFSSREGAKFTWTGDDRNIDLKTRHFPITGQFSQSFVPAIKTWLERGGKIESQ